MRLPGAHLPGISAGSGRYMLFARKATLTSTTTVHIRRIIACSSGRPQKIVHVTTSFVARSISRVGLYHQRLILASSRCGQRIRR